MKVIDILETIGISEQSVTAELRSRLQSEVMIREGDDPFLFYKLSVQRTGNGDRLVIQVEDRALRDPWKS